MFTSQANQYAELKQNMEKLWQVDTLPFRNEKLITRSKQDNEAIDLLNAKTIRVNVDGIDHYATPVLRKKMYPHCVPQLRQLCPFSADLSVNFSNTS